MARGRGERTVAWVPPELLTEVAERLVADRVPSAIAAAVTSALAGKPGPAPMPAGPLRLRTLAVEGFRGVAAPVELAFDAGPGLTLVLGRTGAGKSSIVDALELALCGPRRGRAGRASGSAPWRNLTHPHPAVEVGLAGPSGADVVVRASWRRSADLASLDLDASGADLEALLLAGRRHRPVLSLRQERVVDGVALLAEVLGLDALTAAQQRLRTGRDAARRQVEAQRRAARRLAERCAAVDDRRAVRAARLLGEDVWDLDALRLLACGVATGDDVAGRLRQLADAAVPQVAVARAAADELRAAIAHSAAVAGTDPVAARRRAALLDAAAVHGDDGAGRCPVCQEGAVPDTWDEVLRSEAAALRREAYLAEAAGRRLAAALDAARASLVAPPVGAADVPGLGAATDAVDRWSRWATPPEEPIELVARLDAVGEVIDDAVGAREGALAALDSTDHRWRPLARKLEGWLGGLDAWVSGSEALEAAAGAEAWLHASTHRLRHSSLRPVERRTRWLWDVLGQRSDVELPLPGGADAPGPGVLSQGERHALALSLFLPRATLPSSPFGFVVLDDAAQAFDADRIDVLAEVLLETATTHQVVAFTRDERLVAAAAGARVLELRAEGDATVVEGASRAGRT